MNMRTFLLTLSGLLISIFTLQANPITYTREDSIRIEAFLAEAASLPQETNRQQIGRAHV